MVRLIVTYLSSWNIMIGCAYFVSVVIAYRYLFVQKRCEETLKERKSNNHAVAVCNSHIQCSVIIISIQTCHIMRYILSINEIN